jgi:N-acetylneuraminate synthase
MPSLPTYDFSNLFVFDLANNHQGDVEHGVRIIREVAEVAKRHGVRAAVKFQYRQLDTFIHPSFQNSTDNKHIPRFRSTRLTREQNTRLFAEVREQGLIAMCTPFDEESATLVDQMGFDIIKIASCSARDWPLLEAVAQIGRPMVVSTAGLTLEQIDDLHSFLEHRGADFALMHCVAIYPTPDNAMNLNQIDMMRRRYGGRPIGWSTHEDPNNTSAVQLAYAKGARLFERHVGVTTDKIKLNAYSSTPEQLDRWIAAYKQAVAMAGSETRPPVPVAEAESLNSLQRGVFITRGAKGKTLLSRSHVFFAMPKHPDQLDSGQWRDGIVLKDAVDSGGALMLANIERPMEPRAMSINRVVHEVKALLNTANVPLNSEFQVEYSHHYSMERFREVGAVIINCFNRNYCKKIIVQLPGQTHPSHFHRRKEETFQVLHGVLEVDLDGRRKTLHPGDLCLIQPGVWHSFWSDTGVVFEEISTRHYNDDSFYKDKEINRMAREDRKTTVDNWGRWQVADKAGGLW